MGEEKRFGFLLGGSYDHNNRGIDDVEPNPNVFDFGTAGGVKPVFLGAAIRQHWYDRTRFGFAGSADYKLRTGSSAYVRGLFS